VVEGPNTTTYPKGVTARAAIYTRISLDRDGTSASVQRQEAECRRLCEGMGWEVVEVYSDVDKSAYDPRAKRPSFERLLVDVASKRIDVVVVWKLDRLTRGGLTAIGSIVGTLRDAGADLASVTEQVDTSSAIGEAILGFLAAQAKQESQNTSIRVRAAALQDAKNGQPHSGGYRCFGYDKSGDVVPEEADLITEAARRLLAGESLRQICFDWNERGAHTTTGREWTSSSLSQLLRSPRIAGLRQHRGVIYEGAWQPILAPDHQILVLERLKENARYNRGRSTRSHLLSGLLVCGLCGGALKTMGFRMANGKPFERYQCVRQPGRVNCGKIAISKKSADEHVGHRFLVEWTERLVMARAKADARDDEEDALLAAIAADEAALSELTKAYFLERSLNEANYRETRTSLEERLAHSRQVLSKHGEQFVITQTVDGNRILTTWRGEHPDAVTIDGFAGLSTAEQRRIMATVIERIEVNPAKRRGGNTFDPTRLTIVWR
jgi:site-specific DNA recombinase